MKGVVTVTLNPAVDQTLDVPGFTAGAVNRAVAETRTAGGKGINVAAFLSGGPVPVTATGFLGEDNAAVFEALFRRRHIHDHCLRVPGSSRVNVKVVDREGRSVTDINLPGLEVRAESWRALLGTVDGLAASNGTFVLAGSVPAGVPETAYAELTAHLRARGAFVAVDASGAPLRHAVAARPDMIKPDMIKPNVHELSDLLGRPLATREEVMAAARELCRTGIALVVVSMGAGGAVFVEGGRALLAVPPPVTVASTVGAGDAMVAGVLAARLEGGDLEACARRGTAFAAGTLARLGPELPPPDRIAELMAAVRVEAL